MFYVGCHRPTITLLLYPGLGQAVHGTLAEFYSVVLKLCNCSQLAHHFKDKHMNSDVPPELYVGLVKGSFCSQEDQVLCLHVGHLNYWLSMFFESYTWGKEPGVQVPFLFMDEVWQCISNMRKNLLGLIIEIYLIKEISIIYILSARSYVLLSLLVITSTQKHKLLGSTPFTNILNSLSHGRNHMLFMWNKWCFGVLWTCTSVYSCFNVHNDLSPKSISY